MNNNDFESYANGVDGQGSDIPVSSNGVYDYPYQNVIVPTEGNITMKNVDYPILGISMETGQKQMMLPGNNYNFENTQNVLEIPQFQNGGRISGAPIEPVTIRNLGRYNIGVDGVENTMQLEDYENPGSSTIKNFDDYVLNQYRGWGEIDDFSIVRDGQEYMPSKEYGKDERGNYVDMNMDSFFPNGDNFQNRTYIPDNINDQISLQSAFQKQSVAQVNPPLINISEQKIERQRAYMKEYVGSQAYRDKLSNYYPDARREQADRLTRLSGANAKIVSQKEMEGFASGAEGMSNRYRDHYGNRQVNSLRAGEFARNYANRNYISPEEVNRLEKDNMISPPFNMMDDLKLMSRDGVDNKSIYISDKGHEEGVGVHEFSHYMKSVPRNQYDDITSRTMNTKDPGYLITLEDGRAVPVDYLRTPTEVTSRLDVLRFLMKEEGIKDTTKDLNITEKDLEKALQNPRIKNNYNIKNLIDISKSSQELLWLLNNIVDNRKNTMDNTQYMG